MSLNFDKTYIQPLLHPIIIFLVVDGSGLVRFPSSGTPEFYTGIIIVDIKRFYIILYTVEHCLHRTLYLAGDVSHLGKLGIVKRLVASSELSADEASGVLEVISKYNASFRALKEFDEGYISFARGKKATKNLTPEESMKIISTLKSNVHGDELFGKPRGNAFESSLGAITQTNEKNDLYPSTAEKAANLLYLIIKDHPFYDGNKRIGALLFIVFLTINDYHLTSKGETKISDRALTALALLIAESHPKEKPLLIALICKLLES